MIRRFLLFAAVLLALVTAHDSRAVVGVGPLIFPGEAATPPLALPASGMTLWVNGRTGITTGSTFTWADQSGAGFGNLTQSTSADQPANGGSLNGKNAVLFSGSSGAQLLTGSSALSHYVGGTTPFPFSVAAVFQFTGSATAGAPTVGSPDMAVCSLVGNYVNWGFNVAKYSVTTTELVVGFTVFDSSNKYVSQTGPLYANAHQVMVTYSSGGALTMSVDGAATTTTTGVGANTNYTLPITVGSSNGLSTLQQFDGTVGEYVVWNRVLSGTEITTVASYFTAKWGTLGP